MAALTVYGTLTSPYVRRVRVVARELGINAELVDTTSEEGQIELRERSPIWKVPVAELDGELLFDSRHIVDVLMARHGPGPLRPSSAGGASEENFIYVVDGALDSAIKRFYLDRDGANVADVDIMTKDQARIAACMRWLDERCRDGLALGLEGFGRAEIALQSALEWYRFRNTHDLKPYANLDQAMKRWWDRPSVKETAAPGSRD